MIDLMTSFYGLRIRSTSHEVQAVFSQKHRSAVQIPKDPFENFGSSCVRRET